MLLSPIQAQALFESSGTASGVSVAAAGTANTKGSWTTIVASTAFDYDLVNVVGWAANSGNVANQYAFDIGVGAAASEVVVIPNLMVYELAGGPYIGAKSFDAQVPVSIPAGSRIAARCQSTTASKAMRVWVDGLRMGGVLPGGLTPLQSQEWITYGVSTVSTAGTYVACSASGTPFTWGSWTQIGTTTKAHQYIMPVVNAYWTDYYTYPRAFVMYHVQFGLGASGNPTLLEVGAENVLGSISGTVYPTRINSGVGIYARSNNSVSDGSAMYVHCHCA